jgi:Protein of unknown function (DUF664)
MISPQHPLAWVDAARGDQAESSDDQPRALRWIVIDKVGECARHNGHVDQLLEQIDGPVGE